LASHRCVSPRSGPSLRLGSSRHLQTLHSIPNPVLKITSVDGWMYGWMVGVRFPGPWAVVAGHRRIARPVPANRVSRRSRCMHGNGVCVRLIGRLQVQLASERKRASEVVGLASRGAVRMALPYQNQRLPEPSTASTDCSLGVAVTLV
jgi:hypothetical protein